MTTISDISGKTVFLANIPDIRLGEAESMEVAVSIGQTRCFNETVYCEADGFCWLRDMFNLLRPYLTAGLTEIEVTAGLDVYYFNAFYCLSFIEGLEGSVEDWLNTHFLTTSEAKNTTMKSKERLCFYSTTNVHVSYQAVFLLSDGSHVSVSNRFTADHNLRLVGDITYYDCSPSVIFDEAGIDGQLLGYSVFVEDRSMKFLLDPEVDETQVSRFVYLNAFGVEEDLCLVGTLESPRQIEYTTVSIRGLGRTLSPQLQIPYKLTTGLLSKTQVVSLTEMLSSDSVWFGDTPSDQSLINYSGDLSFVPTSEPSKAARAEFSFSYAFRNRRAVDLNIFDDTFDNTHN